MSTPPLVPAIGPDGPWTTELSRSVPAVVVDLFPALVVFPAAISGTPEPLAVSPARLVVSCSPDGDPASEVLHVFADTHFGPARVYTAPVVLRTGTARGGTVSTSGGGISFEHAGGCGCGSALKVFRPFPGAPHAAS